MRLISRFRQLRHFPERLNVSVEAAPRAGASWLTGDIDLPVAVIWGEFYLPAGEYAFIVPRWSERTVVYVHRPGHGALVEAESVEERRTAGSCALTLVRVGRRYYARSLELAEPAIVFRFGVPEAVSSCNQPSSSIPDFAIVAREGTC